MMIDKRLRHKNRQQGAGAESFRLPSGPWPNTSTKTKRVTGSERHTGLHHRDGRSSAPSGRACGAHFDALKKNRSGIKPLSLFPVSEGNRLPGRRNRPDSMLRTGLSPHPRPCPRRRAGGGPGRRHVPDAIIIGTTTGGMPPRKKLLKKGETGPDAYRLSFNLIRRRILCAAELRLHRAPS